MSEMKVLFKQGSRIESLEPGSVLVGLEKYYSSFTVDSDEVVYVLSWKVTGDFVKDWPNRGMVTIAEQGRQILEFVDLTDKDAQAIRYAIGKYDELTNQYKELASKYVRVEGTPAY